MKIRTFTRHIRESGKSLRRNGWMTFASTSAVTVTLLLVGVFFVMMMNMNKVADDIEKDVEIRVYIELMTTKEEQQQLKKQIEGLDHVESVIYSSKKEELEKLISDLGRDFSLFKQDNPLYDVFVVKASEPTETPSISKKIEKFSHVFSVKYGEGKVEKLFSFLKISRNVGIVMIIGLLFTAMFLISNTIKITIFARRKEIEIMKLVGATNWFIRWPFLMEGMWLGILGAILPITIVSIAYRYAYAFVTPRLGGTFINILPVWPVIFQVSSILLAMGILIGMWGSLMSIRKFLNV